MQKLIEIQRAKPLSEDDIRRIFASAEMKVRIITHESLRPSMRLDELVHGVDAVVILLQVLSPDGRPARIGHWSVIIPLQGRYKFAFFESYQMSFSALYSRTHERPILRDIIFSDGRVDTNRTKPYQALRKNDSVCGRLACLRAILGRGMTNSEFARLIKKQGNPEDFSILTTMLATLN